MKKETILILFVHNLMRSFVDWIIMIHNEQTDLFICVQLLDMI